MTSSLPSSDQHQSRADACDLHALGYAQELFRTMGSKKADAVWCDDLHRYQLECFRRSELASCEESF